MRMKNFNMSSETLKQVLGRWIVRRANITVERKGRTRNKEVRSYENDNQY